MAVAERKQRSFVKVAKILVSLIGTLQVANLILPEDDKAILRGRELAATAKDVGRVRRNKFLKMNRNLDKSLGMNTANINEGPTVRTEEYENLPNSIPIFWHIPKASGTTVKRVYVGCYGLANAGAFDSKRQRSLSRSGVVDIFVAMGTLFQNLHAFTPDYPLRIFTIFRPPVEQAVSKFYYLQHADWEKTYAPETKGWSIAKYVAEGRATSDYVTRILVDKREENVELTEDDFILAKLILRQKVLVGLSNRVEESLARFESYFDLVPRDTHQETAEECKRTMLEGGTATNSHPHPKVKRGSDDWELLASLNKWDIKLYDYAVELFEEQGRKLFGA